MSLSHHKIPPSPSLHPPGFPPLQPPGFPPLHPSGFPPLHPSGFPPLQPSGFQAFSLPLLSLLLALTPLATRADDTPPPPAANPLDSYITRQSDTITILHPPGEETFADDILQSYSFPLRLLDDASFDAQLDRWKKRDIPLVVKMLALEKPAAGMDDAFTQFRAMCLPAISEEIREARIYHLSDIKAAHALGVSPEGITFIPKDGTVNTSIYITAERPGAAKIRVIPVILPPKDTDWAPDEKMRIFNNILREMRWRLDDGIYTAYCGRVLADIVRSSIITSVDKARFPLWLIEGMTGALPLVVIRSHNPGLSFEQLLQTHFKPPENFAENTARINLDTWLLTRTPATPKPEADAYSYLAMLATLDAIQSNGEDWIPGFLQRLRAENSPALNMASLYGIFTEITGGKDLHDNIASVKSRFSETKN